MRLGIIAGIALVLGLGWWLLSGSSLKVDPEAQAALPAIEQELERTAGRGAFDDGRWFCAAHIIETEPDNDTIKLGLDVLCDQFVPRDGNLILGSGYHEPKVATISGTAVRHIDSPPLSSPVRWEKNNFSSAGHAELESRRRGPQLSAMSDAIVGKARQAFGLPADAKVLYDQPVVDK